MSAISPSILREGERGERERREREERERGEGERGETEREKMHFGVSSFKNTNIIRLGSLLYDLI